MEHIQCAQFSKQFIEVYDQAMTHQISKMAEKMCGELKRERGSIYISLAKCYINAYKINFVLHFQTYYTK